MAYIGNIPAEQFTSVDIQNFSVSATANYTLDRPVANENEIELFINNVRQHPGSGKAYTASGTALTLSEATAGTDTMYCVYQGKARQTVTPADSSVTNSMLAGSIANDKLAGSIANSKLANSSITLNGSAVSLGGSATVGEDNTPYFFATGNAAQTISNSTDTVLQYNTESLDSANGYNTSTYRYTVQSGGAGLWFLQVGGYFDSASSWGSGEQVQIQIRVNGTARMNNHVYYGGANNNWIYRSGLDQLSVGDYLDAVVWQNSGGTINWYNNNVDNSVFGGFRVKSI